jgi:hypothetical protein
VITWCGAPPDKGPTHHNGNGGDHLFLLAATAVLLTATGRLVGSRWWKALTAGAWGLGLLAVIVMLSRGLWSLGHATIEPRYPLCGWPFAAGLQTDYFLQGELLAWLGFSGSCIARTPRRPCLPSSGGPRSAMSHSERGGRDSRPASPADSPVRRSGWASFVQPLVPGLLVAFLAPWGHRPGMGVAMSLAAIALFVNGASVVVGRVRGVEPSYDLRRPKRERGESSHPAGDHQVAIDSTLPPFPTRPLVTRRA